MTIKRILRAAWYFAFRPGRLFARLFGTAEGVAAPVATATDVPTFDGELNVVLGHSGSLVALDIGGAGDLQPHWHRLAGVADFVVYEPHNASFRTLIDRQAKDPLFKRFRYINEALSGAGGARTFYATNVPTGSSLLRPKKGGFHDFASNSYFWPLEEQTIETVTLAESLGRHGVDRIDMIKLDTQGTEMEILTGLDAQRLSQTLLIEAECAILDIYEGGERGLEDMMRFMREKGFVLFDLRTNRFIGNSIRLAPGVLRSALGDDLELPPSAHRLAEVDAIFARDPRALVESGADPGLVRRLIAVFVTYNFFGEAVFTTIAAHDRGLFNAAEAETLLISIRNLKAIAGRGLDAVANQIRNAGGLTWAQYMWQPYPSA
jgi:FkbM family methyltransferase